MPTPREHQVGKQQQHPYIHKGRSVDAEGEAEPITITDALYESPCDWSWEHIDSLFQLAEETRTTIKECSASVQCSFCRWRRHNRREPNAAEGELYSGEYEFGMDPEDQWCGQLIRDQHGIYGKLTPVFREHFSNRRKTDEEKTTMNGTYHDVNMETAEGSTSADQQRNLILAAQLGGLSLAERRLGVAPRITLTSVDGDSEEDGRFAVRPHLSSTGGSSSDVSPCRSAGLESGESQGGSPLSPNFLAVPQLQEVGKEKRPASMVA